MTWAGLTALLSHWRRNPLQLFTLIAGLAMATALWTGVQAINSEARASYDAAASTLNEGQFAQILPRDGRDISQADYIKLRRAGWLVSPVVQGRFRGLRLMGIEPITAPNGFDPFELNLNQGIDPTAFLDGRGMLIAHPNDIADLQDLGIQTFSAPDSVPGIVITDIGTAQQLLSKTNLISRLVVNPVQPMGQPALETIAPHLDLRAAQSGSDIAQLTDSFHLNLTAFGLLAFAVGIFIVHGAVGMAFEQRRSTIRTLRALGLPLSKLISIMFLEMILLALIAGSIGVTLGYLVATLLLPDVAATLRGLYGASVSGTLQVRPEWWLSGLGIAVFGTLLAASSALWRIARMPLLASAQPRAWGLIAGRIRLVQLAVSLALLLCAALLAQFGTGLFAGFAMLGAMLIGSALGLPLLLELILRIGSMQAQKPISEWFWADSKQQLPGLSLALMALLLAMATNVGVSTMVSSFRLTFIGFLDQRLSSEMYVTADSADQAKQLVQLVRPHVDAVLPLYNVQRELAGMPAELYGARDHQTYVENWTFLDAAPQAWDRLHADQGIIINEQMARRTELAIGDIVTVTPELALPIVGIYGDYGNPIGQAVMSESQFVAQYPNQSPLRFGLRLPPEQVPELMALLVQNGQSEANMIDQNEIKSVSLRIFERTFAVTSALNVLTLSVAGFSILMSLLTLAGMRLPQLAPIWAMGTTRGQLGRLELLRAVLLALLTTVLAVPLGLMLAWALLSVVNVAAFGWQLPMMLFPGAYFNLLVLGLAAATLAAAWPALRLARTPPSVLLGVFSNER